MSSADVEMSTQLQPNPFEGILHYLRCYICKDYLSCSPLRVLPDGNTICGRCSPSPTDKPVYRTLVLENVLGNVKFPCRFESSGCSEQSSFDEIAQHETVCEHRPIPCIALPSGNCSWKGKAGEVMEHLTNEHNECLVENGAFKISVEKDIKDRMLVFERNNVVSVIRYYYCSDEKELKYCIGYLGKKSPNVSYKIVVLNDTDKSCHVTLKQSCFGYYRPGINETALNIKPYLEILGNCDCILFTVELTVEDGDSLIDHHLLAKLKCSLCSIYVTQPVYKKSNSEPGDKKSEISINNDHFICGNCAEKNQGYEPVEDNKLAKIMARVNYPCRWKNCRVVKKAGGIRQHEKQCSYGELDCPLIGCYQTFGYDHIYWHFNEFHNKYKYFTKSHTEIFQGGYASMITLYTFEQDNVIVFQGHITENGDFRCGVIPSHMTSHFTVYFQHDSVYYHCSARTNQMEIQNGVAIKISAQLRCCFKNQKTNGVRWTVSYNDKQ